MYFLYNMKSVKTVYFGSPLQNVLIFRLLQKITAFVELDRVIINLKKKKKSSPFQCLCCTFYLKIINSPFNML